ncbi:MAG: HEAT repeat domain-containing protein [Phycisphaerales bacterium]|nr:HEAT repeat domain-containing protein [Phycisphaerales bacterium]
MRSAPFSPTSHASRAFRAAALGAALAVAGVLLSGCIDAATRAEMAKSDSILGGFKTTPTPREAAAWATDPYDADKRARGTNLVLNSPYGGAEAWLNLYREYVKPPKPGEITSPAVRATAARGLGLHGAPEDVPLLLPLLKDADKSVRLDAIKALQRLHNRVAIDPLIELTRFDKESEPDVRAGAAAALGQYAEPRVLQALIAALADDQLAVSSAALSSLRTLTGNDLLTDDRKAWVKWLEGTREPFASRRPYYYPVFQRESVWLDYVPFVGGPVPNEQPAQPAGMPSLAGTDEKAK